MALTNLERMIQMVEDVFATKSDPDQLDITPEIREQLQKMHPCTLSEKDDGNGPVAWVVVIPTTIDLMNRFLENQITEKELFELTPMNIKYEALYLCSALVLEEYRRKGIVKQLAIEAITEISKDHPIKALFVWAFSEEGYLASETIARLTSLPLYKRASVYS